MRAKLFFRNSFITLITQLLCYFVDFICRTVLIHSVSMEYVGVTGLFSNILAVLSLSELGFSTALVYAMYAPIAQKDEDRLIALTNFYKRAYQMASLAIGGIGICLTPFLPYIINDCPDLPGLSLFYVLYLANTVASYCFVYKQSLFLADQKLYITNSYTFLVRIVKSLTQIVLLITTHNFTLYLAVMLPFTLLTNILLSRRAQKEYPFLNSDRHPSLDPNERKSIFKNVFAVFNHRVGAIVLNCTDNLLISFFFGLTAVSQNESYNLVLTLLRSLSSAVQSSLNSGIGNYYVANSKEDTHTLFETLHYGGFWAFTFCSVSFFLLINPFISFIWGEQFLFPIPIVFLISINFFILGIRQVPLAFKESMGLLYQDRYKPIIESVINLLTSILLAKFLGIIGIFIGTFVCMVSTSLWVEPYILFHYGFQRSTKTFWQKNIRYILVGLICIAVSWLCTLPFSFSAFTLLVVRAVICLIVPNTVFILLTFKTPEFHKLLDIVRQAIKNK